MRATMLGFDGVELMVRDPGLLDWPEMQRTLNALSLEVPQILTGQIEWLGSYWAAIRNRSGERR